MIFGITRFFVNQFPAKTTVLISTILFFTQGQILAQCANYCNYPQWASQVGSGVRQIARTGNLIVATTDPGYLCVFDFSNKSDPVAVGELYVGSTAWGLGCLAAIGNYVYCIDERSWELKTIDISLPSMPVFVDNVTVTLTDELRKIIAYGTALYVICYNDVFIFDITAPSEPQLVDSIPPNATDAVVENGVLYLAVGGDDLVIYDLEDPLAPTLISQTDFDVSFRYLAVDDGFVYAINSVHDIYESFVIDARNETFPEVIDTIPVEVFAVDNGTIYTINIFEYLGTLEVWHRLLDGQHEILYTSKVPVSQYLYNAETAIIWDGDIVSVYLTNGTNGINYTSLTGVGDCAPPGSWCGGVNLCDLDVAGSLLVAADFNFGVRIFDFSAGGVITPVSSINLPDGARSVAIGANHVLVADNALKLRAINISNPSLPVLEPGSLSLTSNGEDIVVAGNRAVVAMGWSGIMLVDISSFVSMSNLAESDPGGFINRIAVDGFNCYVARQYSGLSIYDLGDATNPIWAPTSSFDPGGGLRGISIQGNCLFVAAEIGFHIIDVSDRAHPFVLSTVDLPIEILDLTVRDGIAYAGGVVSNGGGYTWVFDVSDPHTPHHVAGISNLAGGRFASAENFIVGYAVAPPSPCLASFPFQCDDYLGIDDDPVSDEGPQAEIPNALSISAVVPNPFNPRTTVWMDLPFPGRVTLTVHDLRGRLVRTLWDGLAEAGRHPVVWNGLDGRGHQAASGVYLVRLVTANGDQRAMKMTLSK